METSNMEENTNNTGGQEQNPERFIEKNGDRLEVSENFWDKENNRPDVYNILKSQMDLRKQIGEDLSPKDGIYKINIPDEYKDKLQENKDDPLYKEFCTFAKQHRISQEDFDKLSKVYYKTLYDMSESAAGEQISEEDWLKQEADKFKAKYGDRGDKMKTRIDNFIKNSGITDQDILNELAFMQTSASGVATLDYLLSLRGEPMPDDNGQSRAGVLSLEELRALQAKPEYYSDPVLQKKVEDGYKALYGDR